MIPEPFSIEPCSLVNRYDSRYGNGRARLFLLDHSRDYPFSAADGLAEEGADSFADLPCLTTGWRGLRRLDPFLEPPARRGNGVGNRFLELTSRCARLASKNLSLSRKPLSGIGNFFRSSLFHMTS